jgi:hypothetical protein
MPPVHARAEYEFRVRKIAMITEMVSMIFSALCKWGGFAFMAWCTWGIAAALSGEHTTADIAFRAALDMRADQYAAYILGGGGVIYGIRERRLRRKTTSRLTERTASLEKRIDPNRTSTGLPSSGDTRLEDQR